MAEFNLSDVVYENDCFIEGTLVVEVQDIKKFIRLLKGKMGNTTRGLNNKDLQIFYKELDNLAGDKLK